MAKILLDYVFPISVVETTPEASTAFLKQVCVVANPKAGQEGNVGTIYECDTMTEVAARTDNTNAQQLFNAGMSKVFVLLADDLDMAEALVAGAGEFWTVLVSDDFGDGDIGAGGDAAVAATKHIQDVTYTAVTAGTAGNSITVAYADTNTGGAAAASVTGSAIVVSIESGVTTAATIVTAIGDSVSVSALVTAVADVGDTSDPQVTVSPTALTGGTAATGAGTFDVGAFDGVVGYSTDDADTAQEFGAQENQCGFFVDSDNGAKSMFYAFGSLLANQVTWANQQYISMPVDDGVDTLGAATSLFDDKVSFVIHDTEFGNRLALFVAGGKAIVAPYIGKNIRLDLQSKTLSWITANQPSYTLTEAALLEQRLQEDILNLRYIETKLVEAAVIEVKLLQSNFVASGFIDISEPKALWRMLGEMTSTL